MVKSPIIYLNHILDCLNKIKSYTSKFRESDFLENSLVQDAVIRNFEIIGEATKQLDPPFKLKYPEVEWKKIGYAR